MTFRPRAWAAMALVGTLVASPFRAEAQQLDYLGTSTLQGGGLGNVLTVLTLLNPGGTNSESGCVSPTGFAGCGFTNANIQQGQSQVQPLSALGGVTGQTFQLYLNAAEPGNDNTITLNSLVVTLYGANNQTWSASFGPRTFTDVQQGTGNYGYLFGINSAAWASFNAFIAANPNAVIGAGASFTNAEGGLETINVGVGRATQVPEPASLALLATGLAAFMVRRRRAVA